MSSAEFQGILATFGPVGALVFIVVYALIKSGFLARDDPSRNDVLKEVRASHDKLDDKLDKMGHELTDRLARIETRQSEHGRRLDRLE